MAGYLPINLLVYFYISKNLLSSTTDAVLLLAALLTIDSVLDFEQSSSGK